jgi:hypothetical protein
LAAGCLNGRAQAAGELLTEDIGRRGQREQDHGGGKRHVPTISGREAGVEAHWADTGDSRRFSGMFQAFRGISVLPVDFA